MRVRVLQYPESGHPHPYPTGEDLLDPSVAPYRVWVPQHSLVVLGASQEPERELHVDAIERENLPVYKRKCGGGAVLLSPGCVCLGLRLRRRPGFGISEYFDAANGFIRDTLREEFGVEVEPRGISDLAWNERKISGSSLYLPRACAIFLASIVVNASLESWDRFLKSPSRRPDYRNQRGHSDFVRNLCEIPGGPENADQLEAVLLKRCGEGKAPA